LPFNKLGESLAYYLSSFSNLFKNKTKDLNEQLFNYLKGLVASPLANLQVISEHLQIEEQYQNLHHFLHDSKWDYKPVMDKVAQRFVENCNTNDLIFLLIDEMSVVKKGKMSAGVSRQYCGSLGKVENCQVGVFSALSNGQKVSIINSKLYLPQEWVDDKERCKKAHIPENDIVFKTKIDLAWEQIEHTKNLNIPFECVHFDGFYGRDTKLLKKCDESKIHFMADIPSRHTVSLQPFEMKIPNKIGKRGRKPSKEKPTETLISVSNLAKSIPIEKWKTLEYRKGSKGSLKANFYKTKVWLKSDDSLEILQYTLLIRKDFDGTIKFDLTNYKEEKTLEELAYIQAQRYFIERAFQDNKQQIGAADYQSRSYLSYHRHMAICMLASQFINEQRNELDYILPNISVADMVKIIVIHLNIPILTPCKLQNRLFKKYRHCEINDTFEIS
jgi:SRSO17 transposase